MSLGPVILREPGDEIPASDRIIYRAFIEELDKGTTELRAALRAAQRCGVRRRRVLEIIRNVNKEVI